MTRPLTTRIHDGEALPQVIVTVQPAPRGTMPTIEAVMFPDSPRPMRYATTMRHWGAMDPEMAEAAARLARLVAAPGDALVMSAPDPGSMTRVFSFVSLDGRAPLTITFDAAPARRAKPKANPRRRWR